MNTATPRIELAIREHLAPVLRADGFAGSGRTFRRVVGEWIHILNVQGSRYGGQFSINLAVHPIVIQDVRGDAPDPKKITEELCEFRRRMSESRARQDMWWKHDSTAESMASAVRDAAVTYVQVGRGLLDDATAENADLNTVSPAAFAGGDFNFFGFGSTECRMALALARLRRAKGQLAESQAFAAHALQKVGSAGFLRAVIQVLLPQHDA
jgi:hypothetical protein